MFGSANYNSTLEVYSLRKLISYHMFNIEFANKLTDLFSKRIYSNRGLKSHIKKFTFDLQNKQYIIVTDKEDNLKIRLLINSYWNESIRTLCRDHATQLLFSQTNGVDASKINLTFRVLDNTGLDFIISQAFPVLDITPSNQSEECTYIINLI